jgi:hypothetical protein
MVLSCRSVTHLYDRHAELSKAEEALLWAWGYVFSFFMLLLFALLFMFAEDLWCSLLGPNFWTGWSLSLTLIRILIVIITQRS